ncbi:MAG: Helix-turn-helix domain [Chitinophagaceae bacterium]|nr:Helix-turn-helix domain [Chitinophagaceae bacterium]
MRNSINYFTIFNPNNLTMIFWRRLKQLRIQYGLTQQEMSERLYMAQSTYSRYENDVSKVTTGIVIRIAKEFKVTTDWLLNTEETDS